VAGIGTDTKEASSGGEENKPSSSDVSPTHTSSVNFDPENAKTSEEPPPRKTSHLKFGGAAKKVTKMLKNDAWGDALTVMDNHRGEVRGLDQENMDEFHFLDMPFVTPLHRQIMLNKKSKKQEIMASYSSAGSSGSEVDRAAAHRLRNFRRAASNASSSEPRSENAGGGVDVGELMGVVSPSVKRSLSKSKSKLIAETHIRSQHILRADSFEDKNSSDNDVVSSLREEEGATRLNDEEKGPSAEINNAKLLNNHVIVIGCLDFLVMFVKVLRKSNLSTHKNYHSILIVSEEEPMDWSHIKQTYRDVYFLRRGTVTDQDFLYMNLRSASSVTVFGSRTRTTLDAATNIDSQVLFKYLAIAKKIPAHVNITVEIFRPSSVGVINSAITHHSSSVASTTQVSTGISRKGISTKGNMKIAGNHHSSFDLFSADLLELSDEVGEEMDTIRDSLRTKPMAQHEGKIVPLRNDLRMLPMRRIDIASVVEQKGYRGARRRTGRNSIAGIAQNDLEDLEDLKGSQKAETRQCKGSRALNFWGSSDTHHVMPVFAAGRAFVPTAFDAIFIQVGMSITNVDFISCCVILSVFI
jgi:hypothetical protein